MLKNVDPNLPIEIEFTGAGPLPCITEGQTEHGYWWRLHPIASARSVTAPTRRQLTRDGSSRSATRIASWAKCCAFSDAARLVGSHVGLGLTLFWQGRLEPALALQG
jgi:hypothetical protein